LIAAGKTDAVEKSHIGWMKTDMFHRWLAWLRGVFDNGQPFSLLLSCDMVHRSEQLKHSPSEFGINLVLVPPRLVVHSMKPSL
jgi:hypothetical protein